MRDLDRGDRSVQTSAQRRATGHRGFAIPACSANRRILDDHLLAEAKPVLVLNDHLLIEWQLLVVLPAKALFRIGQHLRANRVPKRASVMSMGQERR